MVVLKEGSKAPDFSLPDQEGKVRSLKDYVGKKLAVYFYPKDDTPGCTTQGCNIRDNYSKLIEKGINVVGISKDNVESHKKFASKFKFNFPILSDEKMQVLKSYGVWQEKSLYGKTFLGIKRTTFLIDEKGVIIKIIEKPDVANHAKEIAEGFGLKV
ncbi:MAG: thioredoxin-dependent thiol peroxidase [Candidatus Diapherotrites archaeon]